MKQYTLGFAFNHNRSAVALIKKTRPDWQKGFLNGIGGKLEKDELPIDGIIREFFEETGKIITNWTFMGALHGPDASDPDSKYIMHVFKTFSELHTLRTTTEEEVVIVDLNRLHRRKLVHNLDWLIQMLLDDNVKELNVLSH